MYFRILHDEASGELSYLLADLDAREAVLIDPRGRDLPVLAGHALGARVAPALGVAHPPSRHTEPQGAGLLGAPGCAGDAG